MGFESIDCPSCGKETFNREFCIFCGKKIRDLSKKTRNSKLSSDNEFDKFQVELAQQKLKSILELKNKIEKEIDELNISCNDYQNQRKKYLSDFQNKQKTNKKKIEELSVLLKLEEIPEIDFTEQKEILSSEIKKNREAIKRIKEELEEIEKIKKITLNQSLNKKKIKQKLADLELAHKNSQITNQIYTKLKTKYEKQLKNEKGIK